MRPTFLKRTPPTLASQHRSRFCDNEWIGIRKKALLQITAGAIAFMLWFLGCLCCLFGSLYNSHECHANLHILAVDYDGGAISQALQAAYSQLKGHRSCRQTSSAQPNTSSSKEHTCSKLRHSQPHEHSINGDACSNGFLLHYGPQWCSRSPQSLQEDDRAIQHASPSCRHNHLRLWRWVQPDLVLLGFQRRLGCQSQPVRADVDGILASHTYASRRS
jgi:hypothetical protein